jgi:hypothetical protein
MRLFLAIITLLVSLSIVEAAQRGSSGRPGLGFSCDVNDMMCSCKGVESGADCKAMKKNCDPKGIFACDRDGCRCDMAARRGPTINKKGVTGSKPGALAR